MIRFGDVIDEVAAVCYAAHPQAILVRSRARSLFPAWNRDQRLLRRLAAPVLFIGAADQLVGEQSLNGAGPARLTFPDKVKAIYHLPVFAGMSRKELELIARNLDEANVDAGTVVIREGKSNLLFWIVLDGEFELTLRGNNRAHHAAWPGRCAQHARRHAGLGFGHCRHAGPRTCSEPRAVPHPACR